MASNDAAKEKMKAALKRLDEAVDRKIADTGFLSNEADLETLNSANAKLLDENNRLRELNQDSAKKLDIAIGRINNVISADSRNGN